MMSGIFIKHKYFANMAQLAEAVEYTDCISAEGKDSTNECPVYDAKKSDGEAPLTLESWGMWSTP